MVTVCCCYIYIFFFLRMRVFSFVFFFKIIVAFIVASFVGRCPPKKVGDAKIRDIFIRGIFIFWQIRNFFFFFFWSMDMVTTVISLFSDHGAWRKKSGGRCGRQGRGPKRGESYNRMIM